MRIAINPSTQFQNPYVCAATTEGVVMGDCGRRVVDRLNKYGAPSIEARLFWDAGPGDSYAEQVAASDDWGADYLVSFHTDSAGNQDNDGRGYTGSLLCYSNYKPAGTQMGLRIQRQMTEDFSWPNAGARDRTGTLAVLFSRSQSFLLEIGNHSDPDDCQFILANLDKFADSIAWGIFNFLGINPRKDKQEDDEMISPPVEITSWMQRTGTRWQTAADFASNPDHPLLITVADNASGNVKVDVWISWGGKSISLKSVPLAKAGPTFVLGSKDFPAGYNGTVYVNASGPVVVQWA